MKSLLYWLKTKAIDIREFFWPLLDAETESDQVAEDHIKIVVTGENVEKALDLQFRIYDSEDDRRKSIESKASLFISTISVTTSVVVASNALIVGGKNEIDIVVTVSVFLSVALSIYMARTVWFSVKALQRGNYSVLGPKDINIKGNSEKYHKELIACIHKKIKSNYKTINSKVDNLTMAQEYYKRAIIVICIYALLVLIFCFFGKKQNIETYNPKPRYASVF